MSKLDLDRVVYEGYTVGDMIRFVEPELKRAIRLGRPSVATRKELAEFCRRNQPYTSRRVPGMVPYFAKKYGIN